VSTINRARLLALGFCLLNFAASRVTLAVEPGVDIAVPRVAITNAGQGGMLIFAPASLRIEPGDYVRWKWVAGFHTTTSGG